jgi:hypothetical protein
MSTFHGMMARRWIWISGVALVTSIGLAIIAGVAWEWMETRAERIEETLYAQLRDDHCIRHPKLAAEIHVKAVHGRKLVDAIFKRRAPDGNGFDVIVRAREAELRVDLSHQQILIYTRPCEFVQPNEAVSPSESSIWAIDLPSDFGPDFFQRTAVRAAAQ